MNILEGSLPVVWTSFLFYSFCGWLMETVMISIREKHFVNRGFLNGPLCPIYGVGMIGITLVCEPFAGQYLVIYLLGMVTASLVEYITAWLLETLFKASWWDYSNQRFNLKGRICLKVSLYWGLLALLFTTFVLPAVKALITGIDPQLLRWSAIITGMIFTYDVVVSTIAAAKLTKRLGRIFNAIPDFDYLMQTARELDYVGFFDSPVGRYSLRGFFTGLRKLIGEVRQKSDLERIKTMSEDRLNRLEQLLGEFSSDFSLGEARLVKAFPRLKWRSLRDYLDRGGNHDKH